MGHSQTGRDRDRLSVGGRGAGSVNEIHSWREWISFIRAMTGPGMTAALLSGRDAGVMLRYPFRKSLPFPMSVSSFADPCA